MNCLRSSSGITWSVFRHYQNLHKLSPKGQIVTNLSLHEFATKTLALRNSDFSSQKPNCEIFNNRLLGTCRPSLLKSYNNDDVQKRSKSMKGQGRHGKKTEKEKKVKPDKDVDSDDEVEVSDIVEDSVIPEEEDPTLPKTYKHRTAYVKTIRADSIISAGLAFSRNHTDEVFYSSLLRLNGEKLLKKSKKVNVGDYVDFILNKETQRIRIQRVKLVKIDENKTDKNKYILTLRIWKTPFVVKEEKKEFVPWKS